MGLLRREGVRLRLGLHQRAAILEVADLHPRLHEPLELTRPPHLVRQGEVPRMRPPGARVWVAL
eukprot:3922766-Prorocentrum_lima.AAC.1